MDGVLADFRKGVHEAFGKPYDYSTLSKKWTFWDDWPGVTLERINAVCNAVFWEYLLWTYDGHDILRIINYKFAPTQIYLLTDPVIGTGTETGKALWVKYNLPMYTKRTIITQAPKHLLARPDVLLIDDKDENVDGFREAGGKGILINRPWNAGHERADRTVGDLIYELEKYT